MFGYLDLKSEGLSPLPSLTLCRMPGFRGARPWLPPKATTQSMTSVQQLKDNLKNNFYTKLEDYVELVSHFCLNSFIKIFINKFCLALHSVPYGLLLISALERFNLILKLL